MIVYKKEKVFLFCLKNLKCWMRQWVKQKILQIGGLFLRSGRDSNPTVNPYI